MLRRAAVLSLVSLCLLTVAMPAPCAQAEKQTVMVPMTDGVKLATDIHLPPGEGPWPTILMRTPYNRKRGGPAAVAARLGYAGVIQDMRGRFDSEGENLPFIGCGWVDHADGADTVAWIRKQPWSNGKIGTFGASAGGITQNLMAGAAPEGLVAQYIVVAAASLYTDAAYTGGALRKEQAENWTSGNKFAPEAIEMWRDHAAYDEWWHRFDSTRKHAVMNAPAVHVGGWFDTFSQGTLDAFAGRQYHGAAGAKGRQKLVMGPWTHGGIGRARQGDLRFPRAIPPLAYEMVQWFACHLKGAGDVIMSNPAVAYYVMGDVEADGAPGNEWRYADRWPVPATESPYYFGKGGRLLANQPAAAGDDETYTFNPADPCPTVGGRNLTIPAGPMNQNKIEDRADVLNFTTEPLAAPVEVTGRVAGKVFVSSSAADTDLSVRLSDVYPDGRSFLMTDGILRLRYRDSLSDPKPLEPGKVYEVTVDCWSTSIVFGQGHRIRVTITSSNYPRYDLNPGTCRPWTDGCKFVKQTNRIFCNAQHPSRIILPVIKVR